MSNLDEFPQAPEGAWSSYVDHDVVDEHGEKVGVVDDVVYDENVSDEALIGDNGPPQPTWLVVNPGALRAAHFVPVAGSYRAQSGAVVIPWDKSWVKSAPKAGRDHVLTDSDRRELADHYALLT